MLVFLSTFWNEKLQQHPYRMISFIAIIDGIYLIILNTVEGTCSLGLYKVFTWTVYFTNDEYYQLKALTVLL